MSPRGRVSSVGRGAAAGFGARAARGAPRTFLAGLCAAPGAVAYPAGHTERAVDASLLMVCSQDGKGRYYVVARELDGRERYRVELPARGRTGLLGSQREAPLAL